MPYIKQESREALDGQIRELRKALAINCYDEGEMNYVVTRLLHAAFRACPRYSTANALMGMLECAKTEFYRRVVAPHEDKKIKENGDIEHVSE